MGAGSLVAFGLSLSSSWGNGHATTYRGLLRALARRGWQTTFFERDTEWYRGNRDLSDPEFCDLRLYQDWSNTRAQAAAAVQAADVVLVGSYAGDAQEIIDWLLRGTRGRPMLFYDIDTPITLAALNTRGEAAYLRADQVPEFDTYFSFTGGPALRELTERWGARHAEALYCAVDPDLHRPKPADARFECRLGYMGTYAADRQPKLRELLAATAIALPGDRFLVAGPQYPEEELRELPRNVEHIAHVAPGDHPAFYCSNWATLNLTRDAMVRYGWSPSVRLFEAAACGACIVSDRWPGLDELLEPGREVLLVADRQEVRRELEWLTPERRSAIGAAARARVLASHTFERRAEQFEQVVNGIRAGTAAHTVAVPSS